MRDTPPSPAALQRLHARRRNPRTWHTDDLERLEAAYAAAPKLWWHVGAVVPEQVDLVTTARGLQQLGRLSPSLLDALAQTNDRREVSAALQLLLRLVAHRRPDRAWASLADAARTFLHADEGRFDPEGPVAPLLDLAPWATPLTTPAALRDHGRSLATCLGQPSWWRFTALGLGRAFAVEREGEAATVWVVPHTAPGARVEMLTGPRNAPVSPALREAVEAALSAALVVCPRPFSVGRGQGSLPAVTEEAVFRARHALLDAVGPGPGGAVPVPVAARRPVALPGLPAVHWTEHHEAFAWPARFAPDCVVVEPPEADDPPEATVAWDPATGGTVYTTPQGRFTLLPTAPPTLLGACEGAAGASAAEPAALWYTLDLETAQEDEVPEAARHAMACFQTHLPPRVVAAARRHPALSGLPGLWLLCTVPALEPVLDAAPCLAAAVVDQAAARPGSVDGLAAAVAQPAPVPAVLRWLGVSRPDWVAAKLGRLEERRGSVALLRALGRLAGFPAVAAWLTRLHTWLPAQVWLLSAAHDAGLLSLVTLRLLTDIRLPHGGPWVRSRVETAFAELAAAAAETGQPWPRIQDLGHLARLLVRARLALPRPAPPPSALPGPWGAPVTDPAVLGAMAEEVGEDPERWKRAHRQGYLCCLGLPGGALTVTWLRASGRRGALELVAALDTQGQPASSAVWSALQAGLEDHHQRLEGLSPGWCGEEALAAGLCLGLGQITLAGRRPLGSLVSGLVSLGR